LRIFLKRFLDKLVIHDGRLIRRLAVLPGHGGSAAQGVVLVGDVAVSQPGGIDAPQPGVEGLWSKSRIFSKD
jgi:hypothetical protein